MRVEDILAIRDSLASIHQMEPYSLILYRIDTIKCELGFLFVKNAEESIMDIEMLLYSRLRESKITNISFRDKSLSLTETLTDTDGQ